MLVSTFYYRASQFATLKVIKYKAGKQFTFHGDAKSQRKTTTEWISGVESRYESLTMCQPATKWIVLAFLIYMSKLNSWMKEIVPKRDIWSSYRTKSAAADCKQAVNDDERCQSFALVFFQRLHKLFGDIDAITYFKPPDFTNRQILTLICGYGKETFLQI